MKRENNHRKDHPHLGKKIKLTKPNTNVEQKNPTQKIMPGIISNDIEIPISIIVKYVSMRSFKRSIYFIRFFFAYSLQLQSKRDNSSQIINFKKNFKKYLKKIIHFLLTPPSKHYRTSSFKQVACLILFKYYSGVQISSRPVAHGNQNVTWATWKRRKIAQLAIKNSSSPVSLNYSLSICIVIVLLLPVQLKFF